MKFNYLLAILLVTSLFTTGCLTTRAPQPIIDSLGYATGYNEDLQNDIEEITRSLTQAAAQEQSRYYLSELLRVERLIREDPSLDKQASLDEYKGLLAVIIDEMSTGRNFYENLSEDLISQYRLKALKQRQLLLRIREYETSSGMNEATFNKIIEESVKLSQEIIDIEADRIANRETEEDANPSISEMIKDAVVGENESSSGSVLIDVLTNKLETTILPEGVDAEDLPVDTENILNTLFGTN